MILVWLVTAVSLATALLAWRVARATARRLDELWQMYWALKYQHTELRTRVEQAQPPGVVTADRVPEPAGESAPGAAFVPLSSLRR
jgi:hypothetical protein